MSRTPRDPQSLVDRETATGLLRELPLDSVGTFVSPDEGDEIDGVRIGFSVWRRDLGSSSESPRLLVCSASLSVADVLSTDDLPALVREVSGIQPVS